MVISQGYIWWADIPAPQGSEPWYRRPVIVVQGDHLNRSYGPRNAKKTVVTGFFAQNGWLVVGARLRSTHFRRDKANPPPSRAGRLVARRAPPPEVSW